MNTWQNGTVYVQQRPKRNSSIALDIETADGKDIDSVGCGKKQSEKTELASNPGDHNESEKFDSVRYGNVSERRNLTGGLPPISVMRGIAGQENQSSMMTNTV